MHARRIIWMATAALVGTFAATGCGGGSTTTPDGGPAGEDAGFTADSGLPIDAGQQDAGAGDAGMQDGGPDDAGTGDAGTPCTDASECPGTDTDCLVRTCTAGTCGTEATAQGTPVPAQTAGDCQVEVCDGMGGEQTQPDDTDVPADQNACTAGTCTQGTPSQTPRMAGTACAESGGQVCSGAGTCVECVSDADCPLDGFCSQNACVGPSCSDGQMNGSERGIDCGGATCAACPTLLTISRTAAGQALVVGEFEGTTQTWSFSPLGTSALSRGAISTTPAGDALALWQGVADELQYATWTATTATWSSPAAVGAGITTRASPSLTPYATGVEAMFHGQNYLHYVMHHSAGVWAPPQPVGTTMSQSFGPSPGAVTASGTDLVALYFDGGNNNALTERTRTGTVWSTPAVIAAMADFLERPAVAPTSGGGLVAVWVRSDDALMFATRGPSGWSAPSAIPNAFTAGAPSMGADPMGNVGVAFRGLDDGLYMAILAQGTWNVVPLDTAISGDPSLAAGVGGSLAELVYVRSGELRHVRIVNGVFTAPVNAGQTGVVDVSAVALP